MLYIGLMSGTSADGIDLALVDFTLEALTSEMLATDDTNTLNTQTHQPKLVASYYQAYSAETKKQISQLYYPDNNEIDRAFSLDVDLAKQFSAAILKFLQQQNISPEDIVAIGSHGQTIRHRPNAVNPFTLQIGCCQTLATLTGINVIGQFRRKDMALGGQGAPLVPAFHQALFQTNAHDTVVVNIGGIANITYLPKDQTQNIIGFDTGPGNALLDDWFQLHHPDANQAYDADGKWANGGRVNQKLLTLLLNDAYFALPYPKSTGREVFYLPWLNAILKEMNEQITTQDIQATLAALTASSIATAITQLSTRANIYLCGGGVYNLHLRTLLSQYLFNNPDKYQYQITLTNKQGIPADDVEAMAFAWLAFAFTHQITSNIPAVTGASKNAVLGTLFQP